MKQRIRIPEQITNPEDRRRYLLEKGACLTSSGLFDGFDKLKDKCQATFVVRRNGGTLAWGVGEHKKIK